MMDACCNLEKQLFLFSVKGFSEIPEIDVHLNFCRLNHTEHLLCIVLMVAHTLFHIPVYWGDLSVTEHTVCIHFGRLCIQADMGAYVCVCDKSFLSAATSSRHGIHRAVSHLTLIKSLPLDS